MRPLIKANLKSGAAICAILAVFGPNVSNSQTAPIAAPNDPPSTSPVTQPAVPLVPRTDPCAAHIMSEKRANWNSDNYGCEIRSDLMIRDQVPRGVPGGVSQRTQIPNGAVFTKITIYHTDTRIYGLKFSYKTDPADDAEEIQTPVIGGTSGTESEIALTPEMRLHSIRPQFGPDPVNHYTTPVMIGLDVAVYKVNPLISGVDSSTLPASSHDDLIETRRFGARNVRASLARNLPKLTDGFDVHLVQVIRSIEACVSPRDRNGRIFSLGVTTGGLGPLQDRNADFCPPATNNWASQPLGPARLADKTSPISEPYRFVRGETDAFDFASGVYTKLGQEVKADTSASGGDAAEAFRRAKYSEPMTILIEFGDTARIAFGGRIDAVNNLRLVTDPAKLKRGPSQFEFAYEAGTFFVGVSFEQQMDPETRRMKTYTFLTFETTDPRGAHYNGRYREARLSTTSDFVVKRDRRRDDMRVQKLSNTTPLGIGSNATGHDYVFRGHDFVDMSLSNVSAGVKGAIFKQAGPHNFHIANSLNKIVSDGVIFMPTQVVNATSVQTLLNSESEVGESVSRSISGEVNVKGVKAGANWAKSQSTSLTRGANSAIGMSSFEGFSYTLVLDKPAVTVSDEFAIAMREIYAQTNPIFQSRLADEMVSRFGTHFANAVIMGALGIGMSEVNGESYAAKREASETFGASGGAELGKGGGTITMEQTKKQANNNSSSSSTSGTNFFGRGGSGSSGDAFSLSGDNHAPVYYDLRTLDNLVEPIIVSQILPNGIHDFRTDRADATRKALYAAIERRADRAPRLSSVSTRRPLYRLTFKGVSCDDAGGDKLQFNSLLLGQLKEATNRIQLYGKLDAIITTTGENTQSGEKDVSYNLFTSPAVNVDLMCDGAVKSDFITQAPIFTWALDGNPPRVSFSAQMFEDDDGITDPDDNLDGKQVYFGSPEIGPVIGKFLMSGDLLPARMAGPQGRLQKPRVYLNFEWERLE